MRLKCLRSLFSRLIMTHADPHCARYTGSMTFGTSLTKLIAPVTWYSTGTVRTFSHGMGMFSRSLNTAWGTYFRAPRYIRLSAEYRFELMSP